MALHDDILRADGRYEAAHRMSDGRGDPIDCGFRRRISQPSMPAARADQIMLCVAIGCVVVLFFLIQIGAI